MQCKQVHDHLSAYLDRELTAELSSAVRHHLASCPECRAMLEELRATADLLGRLPVREAPAGLADDVRNEIERRMLAPEAAGETPMQERTLAVHRPRPWPRVLAVAAGLALAAGIGLVAFFGEKALEQPAASGPELARHEPRDAARRLEKGALESATEKAPAETGLRLARPAPEAGAETSADAETPPAERGATVPDAAAPPDADELAKAADHRMARAGPAATAEALAEKRAHRREPAAPEPADPRLVQMTMNTVAVGEAPLGSLRQVANADNLDRASNQLVVRAPSRVVANRDLVRLFARNGWRELDERTEEDRARKKAAPKALSRTRLGIPGRGTEGNGPGGLYYLAHRDGEDLWVVVTTADDLSRFATQVAQARTMVVGADSSRPFQAVRRLQKQLAAFKAETFARGGGAAVADDKEALRAGAAAETRSGVRPAGTAGDADSPARKMGPAGGPAKRASLKDNLPAEREAEETTRRRVRGDGGGQLGTGRPVNGVAAEPPSPQTAAAPDETPPPKKPEAEGEALEWERAEETAGATDRAGLGRQDEAESAIPRGTSPGAPRVAADGAAGWETRRAGREQTGPAAGKPSGESSRPEAKAAQAASSEAVRQQMTGQTHAGALQERFSLRRIPPNQVMLVVRVRSADGPPRAAEAAQTEVDAAEPAEAGEDAAPPAKE